MTYLLTGLFFLLILLSGYWLSHAGKPLNAVILAVHKLIGVAAGVFLSLRVYQVHQLAPLAPRQIAAVVVTVLLFAANVASGGLLSTAKPLPALVLRLHQVTPFLIVLSTAAALYLLLSP
jgi:hypothetical protein